jgi:hypothetical protein
VTSSLAIDTDVLSAGVRPSTVRRTFLRQASQMNTRRFLVLLLCCSFIGAGAQGISGGNHPRSPLPGLYAAVEIDSAYENAARHFQYIMLHSQEGAPFKVMRNEATFVLDKRTKEVAR